MMSLLLEENATPRPIRARACSHGRWLLIVTELRFESDLAAEGAEEEDKIAARQQHRDPPPHQPYPQTQCARGRVVRIESETRAECRDQDVGIHAGGGRPQYADDKRGGGQKGRQLPPLAAEPED